MSASERKRLQAKFLYPFQPPTRFPSAYQYNNTVRGLKWIGPVMRGRLQANGINSWADLETYFETHNKHENADLLRTSLANSQANTCVASERGNRDFLINRQYRVRPVNWFAYNSILYYATRHFSAAAVSRLPLPMKPQRARVAFPSACPRHH